VKTKRCAPVERARQSADRDDFRFAAHIAARVLEVARGPIEGVLARFEC